MSKARVGHINLEFFICAPKERVVHVFDVCYLCIETTVRVSHIFNVNDLFLAYVVCVSRARVSQVFCVCPICFKDPWVACV